MHLKTSLGGAAALVLSLAASTFADTIVAPNIPETSGLSTALRALPRQYMEFMNGPTIGIPAGPDVNITGIRFRISADPQPSIGAPGPGVAWPPSPRSFASFQVQLSEASATVTGAAGGAQFPSSTATYASYQDTPTVVTTYNNALTIPTGAFPYTTDGTTPGENDWGFEIPFSTPYQYTPGEELILYIKHSGFGGTDNVFFANGDFAANVADAVSSLDNTGNAATGFSSPYIVQFTYSAVPEPAALSLLGLCAVGLIRRRRA